MNDNTVINDRFYEESPAETALLGEVNTMGLASSSPIPASAKAVELMEFAPEPIHMKEANRKGKFTVGNKYPVTERKSSINICGMPEPAGWSDSSYETRLFQGGSYIFETIDDEGKSVLTDEKFFIPADRSLTFDNYDEFGKESQPDIRAMAVEKEIPKEFDEVETALNEMSVLSGIKMDDSKWKTEPFWKKKMIDSDQRPLAQTTTFRGWPCAEKSSIYDGLVKDDGNDVMYNADKCLAAVSRVFGGGAIIDPDDIIHVIQELVPRHKLSWEDKYLSVDGAKTKIEYDDVQKAFSGLTNLVSNKVAQKAVSKIVANKLKKLF